jgi:hypothetical protein
MIVYLLIVRPYPDWTLHWMEVLMHLLELAIMIFAISIMSGDKSTVGWSWGMIALFGCAFGLLMLYEFYFMIKTAWAAWVWVRNWWQARGKPKAKDADSEADTGETTAPELEGARAEQAADDAPAEHQHELKRHRAKSVTYDGVVRVHPHPPA